MVSSVLCRACAAEPADRQHRGQPTESTRGCTRLDTQSGNFGRSLPERLPRGIRAQSFQPTGTLQASQWHRRFGQETARHSRANSVRCIPRSPLGFRRRLESRWVEPLAEPLEHFLVWDAFSAQSLLMRMQHARLEVQLGENRLHWSVIGKQVEKVLGLLLRCPHVVSLLDPGELSRSVYVRRWRPTK